MKTKTISTILSLIAAVTMAFTFVPAVLPTQQEIPSSENQEQSTNPGISTRAFMDNKDNA